MRKFELKSDKVRAEMKRLGLTERALAKMIPTSQQLLNYWLNKKSLSGVHRIAKALDIDPKDLLI